MNKESGYPDNNPKTASGVAKVPLHLVPPSATFYLATAFADGAKKYGPYNWRDKTVSSSVYIAAAKRHLDAWWDGEEVSSDAQVHHLAHALACLAIVLDAQSIGRLNDDRPTKGAASYLQSNYNKEKPVATKEPATEAIIDNIDAVVNGRVPYVQKDVQPPSTGLQSDGRVAGYGKPCNCS